MTRCAAILVAVLGGLLAAPPAPAHADLFDRTLSVGGRIGIFDVAKGTRVRLDWNFATGTPGFGELSPPPRWTIRVGTRPITCEDEDDSASRVGTWFPLSNLRPSGSMDLDTSGPDFHEGASYHVRGCLRLADRRHHETNQIEIRLITIVATRPAIPLPGTPRITGTLAATPVRPRYMIGVIGMDFGERPGRLLLEMRAGTWSLTDLDWHSRAIAGRIPVIETVPDGPAFLIVERADGSRSLGSSVNFVATREVRLIPGGEVHVDSCSDEGNSSNRCYSAAYPGQPSFGGHHHSFHTFGESGTDQFSIALANGWRFHELEYSHGEADMPVPTWGMRGGGPSNPHIQVHWRNPSGWGIYHHYGFRLYIVGPAGMPHR